MTLRRSVLLALFLAVLAVSHAEAIPCPGNGAKVKVIINNPTATTGQTIFLSGSVVEGQNTCAGQSDTYATTVTLTTALGNNEFTIPVGGGLNTGVWMHHISVDSQFQHQRTPVLFTTDPGQYATVRWTYHPIVFQVNQAGDAAGTCSASACTFRQALVATNNLPVGTTPVLIQLMLSPGNMTQSGDLFLGFFGASRIITIDGTDASGNPWIVGDALAAAQGTQSPFSRAIDLRNTTKLLIHGNNVTVRGVAIANTVPSGSPNKTLIDSIGANTRIEAVRLDGGATGSCGTCTPEDDPTLMRLGGLMSEVANVEARAAFANGAFVTAAPVEIRDSWFHHNYRSGIFGANAVLMRNTIELTGRRRADNVIMNNNGVGVGGGFTTTRGIDTEANLIRNQTSFGIAAQLTNDGLDFAHDAVCGNGGTGISVEGSFNSANANGTGLGTMYNAGNGVNFFGGLFAANRIQFNNDSAFTANSQCGFSNLSNTTASAINNQWRDAVSECSESPDRCTGGLQDPITCDPIQNPGEVMIVLDSQPAFPMNAFLKGQTVRVQGHGFNAIAGNPVAGDAGCSLGSGDVSNQNCCRNKTKANVCEPTGAPPPPALDGSNCVAMVDPTFQWKRLSVTSVTPTTIVTEVPDPALLCVGEGLLQSVRVVKRRPGGDEWAAQMDYCRNPVP